MLLNSDRAIPLERWKNILVRIGQSIGIVDWRWRVLCYHTIDFSQIKNFRLQLNSLVEWGFCIRPFSRAFSEFRQCSPPRLLTLSFDDGDWSVCSLVQPILDEIGVKGIFYLATNNILQGSTYHSNRPRPATNWEALRRWIAAGHEIGGHTHTHVSLPDCDLGKIRDEMMVSREMIMSELGVRPAHFAYPWGRYSPQVLRWFESQCEWSSAATVNGVGNRSTTNPFCLGRNVMEPDFPIGQFQRRVTPLLRVW